MRYTQFVVLTLALMVVSIAVVGAVFVAFLGPGGLWFIAMVAPFALLGFSLNVAWTRRAVQEFGGEPFGGVWGPMGSDIEADGNAPRRVATIPSDRSPRVGVLGAYAAASDGSTLPDWAIFRSSRTTCPHCGAVTEGSDLKFCRLCGSSFGR